MFMTKKVNKVSLMADNHMLGPECQEPLDTFTWESEGDSTPLWRKQESFLLRGESLCVGEPQLVEALG